MISRVSEVWARNMLRKWEYSPAIVEDIRRESGENIGIIGEGGGANMRSTRARGKMADRNRGRSWHITGHTRGDCSAGRGGRRMSRRISGSSSRGVSGRSGWFGGWHAGRLAGGRISGISSRGVSGRISGRIGGRVGGRMSGWMSGTRGWLPRWYTSRLSGGRSGRRGSGRISGRMSWHTSRLSGGRSGRRSSWRISGRMGRVGSGGRAADGVSGSQTVGASSDCVVGLISGNNDETTCFNLDSFLVNLVVVVAFEVVLGKLGDIRTVIQTYANPLNSSDRTVLSFEESSQLVVKVAMLLVIDEEGTLAAFRDCINWNRKIEWIAISFDTFDKIRGRNHRSMSIRAMILSWGVGRRIGPVGSPIVRDLSRLLGRVVLPIVLQFLRRGEDTAESMLDAQEGEDEAYHLGLKE